MDVLEWSMPFLMDKVITMLNHIAKKSMQKGNSNTVESPMLPSEDMNTLLNEQKEQYLKRQEELKKDNKNVTIKKSDVIRAKIKVFARMNYMTSQLRKNSDTVL